jgi:type I restriction enzyme R subunit
VNPSDKFELVFKHLLESLFVERMDQNEEIFVRYMNDASFQKVVTGWMAEEAYRRLRSSSASQGPPGAGDGPIENPGLPLENTGGHI